MENTLINIQYRGTIIQSQIDKAIEAELNVDKFLKYLYEETVGFEENEIVVKKAVDMIVYNISPVYFDQVVTEKFLRSSSGQQILDNASRIAESEKFSYYMENNLPVHGLKETITKISDNIKMIITELSYYLQSFEIMYMRSDSTAHIIKMCRDAGIILDESEALLYFCKLADAVKLRINEKLKMFHDTIYPIISSAMDSIPSIEDVKKKIKDKIKNSEHVKNSITSIEKLFDVVQPFIDQPEDTKTLRNFIYKSAARTYRTSKSLTEKSFIFTVTIGSAMKNKISQFFSSTLLQFFAFTITVGVILGSMKGISDNNLKKLGTYLQTEFDNACRKIKLLFESSSLTVLKGIVNYALDSLSWIKEEFISESSELLHLVHKFLDAMKMSAISLFKGIIRKGNRFITPFISKSGIDLSLEDIIYLVHVSAPLDVLRKLYYVKVYDVRGLLLSIVEFVPNTERVLEICRKLVALFLLPVCKLLKLSHKHVITFTSMKNFTRWRTVHITNNDKSSIIPNDALLIYINEKKHYDDTIDIPETKFKEFELNDLTENSNIKIKDDKYLVPISMFGLDEFKNIIKDPMKTIVDIGIQQLQASVDIDKLLAGKLFKSMRITKDDFIDTLETISESPSLYMNQATVHWKEKLNSLESLKYIPMVLP